MKQTSVSWLIEQLKGKSQSVTWNEIFDKAKEIEKKQIIEAYKEGMGNVDGWIVNKNGVEEYYDEQFKKK